MHVREARQKKNDCGGKDESQTVLRYLKEQEKLYCRGVTGDESALDVAGLGKDTERSAFGDPQTVD